MKLPVINIPLSAKALTTAAVGFICAGIFSLVHIAVSGEVKILIASAVGLAVSTAFKEGVPYVNYWLKKNGIPVDFEANS